MGIRFNCPNGHKLNVKAFLAGKKGICPHCGISVDIPLQSTRGSTQGKQARQGDGGPFGPTPLSGPTGASPATFPAVGQTPAQVPTGPIPFQPVPPQIPATPGVYPALPAAASPFGGIGPALTPGLGPAPISASAPATVPLNTVVLAQPTSTPQLPSVPGGPPSLGGPSPDPLSDTSEVAWYVRPPSGGQYGPASTAVMRSWIQEGRVSADSLVWREGWRDWQDAGKVFPQLGRGEGLAALGMAGSPGVGSEPGQRAPMRRRSTAMQATIITVLVVAVVVLAGVFIWVLTQQPGGPP